MIYQPFYQDVTQPPDPDKDFFYAGSKKVRFGLWVRPKPYQFVRDDQVGKTVLTFDGTDNTVPEALRVYRGKKSMRDWRSGRDEE